MSSPRMAGIPAAPSRPGASLGGTLRPLSATESRRCLTVMREHARKAAAKTASL